MTSPDQTLAADRKAVAAFLATCALFRRLPSAEIEELAGLVQHRRVAAGSVLAIRGTRSEHIFLVESGLLRVDEPDLGVPIELATASSGDAVGCSSLVEPFLYSANVSALMDSQLYQIASADLHEFLRRRPQAGFDVMTAVAQQVRGHLDAMVALWSNLPVQPGQPANNPPTV